MLLDNYLILQLTRAVKQSLCRLIVSVYALSEPSVRDKPSLLHEGWKLHDHSFFLYPQNACHHMKQPIPFPLVLYNKNSVRSCLRLHEKRCPNTCSCPSVRRLATLMFMTSLVHNNTFRPKEMLPKSPIAH